MLIQKKMSSVFYNHTSQSLVLDDQILIKVCVHILRMGNEIEVISSLIGTDIGTRVLHLKMYLLRFPKDILKKENTFIYKNNESVLCKPNKL